MAVSQQHTQLLEKLQMEINLILVQAGRVYLAANKGEKTAAMAQAVRLRQALPASVNRFHKALDQLEDELHTAKLVMRRDLSVYREQTGQKTHLQVNGTEISGNASVHEADVMDISDERTEPTQTSKDDDVQMQLNAEAESKPQETTTDFKDDGNNDQAVSNNATTKAKAPNPDKTPEETSNEIPAEEDSKPSESSLQIDTQAVPAGEQRDGADHSDSDKPPDTGTFSNNADLDSLFNDPASASGGDAPGFGMDANRNEFDFDPLSASLENGSADDDNISALLPGLQDYANNPPVGSGQPDFDALFSTDAPPNEATQPDDPEAQQGPREHRDSTFDGIGDFADFITGDYGEGEKDDQALDFSFS